MTEGRLQASPFTVTAQGVVESLTAGGGSGPVMFGGQALPSDFGVGTRVTAVFGFDSATPVVGGPADWVNFLPGDPTTSSLRIGSAAGDPVMTWTTGWFAAVANGFGPRLLTLQREASSPSDASVVMSLLDLTGAAFVVADPGTILRAGEFFNTPGILNSMTFGDGNLSVIVQIDSVVGQGNVPEHAAALPSFVFGLMALAGFGRFTRGSA